MTTEFDRVFIKVTDDLTRYYINKRWSINKIAKLYGYDKTTTLKMFEEHGLPLRKRVRIRNSGKDVEKLKTKYGYVNIKIDGKWVAEHRYIWEKIHGPLPDGWIVHHINGVKNDNRLENLLGMSRKKHDNKPEIEAIQKRILDLESQVKELTEVVEIYEEYLYSTTQNTDS